MADNFMVEKLGLQTLVIDVDNPRFPQTSSEQEAIDVMLSRIPDKILAMARDIAKHGLNPSTVPVVFATDDGKYIVKDGNRRITSLKVLMNPKLAKDANLRKKFEKIQFDRSDFKYINCVVFDDESAADHWVELNHQNDSTGIGHQDWGAIPKMRDARNHGKSVPVLEMFEMVQRAEPTIDEDNFTITTLNRVVGNKRFKELTGLKVVGNNFTINIPEKDFVNCLVEISKDISDANRPDHIDSRIANSSAEVVEYLEKKVKAGFFENTGNPSSFQY
ncbi:hypothetical protein TALC_00366 [Thermoplasmatales archaeon BRNA1]|nr:hypothetical protein TALC_00366 [Thermoplasmatales archaeon BRNA1]